MNYFTISNSHRATKTSSNEPLNGLNVWNDLNFSM